LAAHYGLDREAAYLAGIGHDLGKALDEGELLSLAEKDGRPVTALEQKKPDLLHGRAAAVLLQERFGIHNKEVLEAVAAHTFGALEPLSMVLFAADKIEFSRQGIDPRFLKAAFEGEASLRGLEALFYSVLEDSIRYLESNGLEAADESLELLKRRPS
jgi:nicotinate-nucleotide adenylyltransferase